ncbi:hypothetical protein KKB40_00820, partial [Patescibacteria group bacterium]|nr:hypothetical protein [Patescibacteria group bacterium]
MSKNQKTPCALQEKVHINLVEKKELKMNAKKVFKTAVGLTAVGLVVLFVSTTWPTSAAPLACPTATPKPTETPVPPTETPTLPPTETPVPPTETPTLPPTETPVPPTETP